MHEAVLVLGAFTPLALLALAAVKGPRCEPEEGDAVLIPLAYVGHPRPQLGTAHAVAVAALLERGRGAETLCRLPIQEEWTALKPQGREMCRQCRKQLQGEGEREAGA